MIEAVERAIRRLIALNFSDLRVASTKTYLNPRASHSPHRRLWLAHPSQARRSRVKYPQHATPQGQTENVTEQSPTPQDVNGRQIVSVG